MATYDVTITPTCVAFADGVDSRSGHGKRIRVDVGGTRQVGDKFNIALGNKSFGYLTTPQTDALAVLTHRSKMHSVAGGELHYSALGDPTGYDRDGDIGAGFINMSTHDGLSAALTGLAAYQEDLAVFARRVVQIWHIDEDQELNRKLQTIKNTGAIAAKSIVSFGESDVFFYSDSGVRSLRARDSSNSASVYDVGTKIDTLILEYAATLTEAQRQAAIGIVEPIDGRYWLTLGERIFIFTYFPTEDVIGWSWYEPGFEISDMAAINDRLYVRSGNTIYLYGGASNDTYDSSVVTATLNYLTQEKPADRKAVTGVDIDCDGDWGYEVLYDPQDSTRSVNAGTFKDVSYQEGVTPVNTNTTHFAPKLTSSGSGYHRVSSLVVHFEGAEQKA